MAYDQFTRQDHHPVSPPAVRAATPRTPGRRDPHGTQAPSRGGHLPRVRPAGRRYRIVTGGDSGIGRAVALALEPSPGTGSADGEFHGRQLQIARRRPRDTTRRRALAIHDRASKHRDSS